MTILHLWYVSKTDGLLYGGTYGSWDMLLCIVPRTLCDHRWTVQRCPDAPNVRVTIYL